MQHRPFAVYFWVAAAVCAIPCLAQTSGTARNGPEGFSGSASFPAPRPFMRAVVNAPYSGDQVVEQVQTLADGTHITRKGAVQKMYRDSLGRTRTERPTFPGLALAGRMPESPTVVEITDPVAKVQYTLDTVNKVAHRQQLGTPPTNPPAQAAVRAGTAGVIGSGGGGGGAVANIVGATAQMPNGMVRPTMAQEKLGTQTIEGVLAEGTRMTSTYAVDTEGNDRPIVVVNETWMSPALKLVILNRSSDPRSGEHTQRLTNINQGEPAAELFAPPSDYSVVDETGPFTLRWGTAR
jgi:hypothetical protein